MDMAAGERRNLAANLPGGVLPGPVPSGSWKQLWFACAADSQSGLNECRSDQVVQVSAHSGRDEISQDGHGSRMFKIVSSAAVNYGRHRVMTEGCGAMSPLPASALFLVQVNMDNNEYR
jgi:hypothetical protein